MLVLVANLGSTSFKFKLLDMSTPNGDVVARGGYERIGQKDSPYKTHGDVIDVILKDLKSKPDAIGFKAVHGGPISGAVRVNADVIATMEQFADVAPAHNPPYIAAMRAFREKLPTTPQVAAFETPPLIPSSPPSLLSFLNTSSRLRPCFSSLSSANVSKSPTRLLCGTPDCAVMPKLFATLLPFSIAQIEQLPPR